MDYSIDRLRSHELDAAGELLTLAYGRPGRWQAEVETYRDLQPEGWFAARSSNGALVGMGGAINYGPFAWIGLMGVLPDRRRRGIAAAILAAILDWLREGRCPVAVLDASAAGQRLYERFGFVDSGRTSYFQRASDARPAIAHEVRPATRRDLDAIVAFDAARFGTERRALLEKFFVQFPQRTLLVHHRGGAIAGYAVANGTTIGPWIADSRDDADALLRAALAFPHKEAPVVLAPSINPHVADLLQRHGFAENRSLRHMVRGGPDPQPARFSIFGQASFATG
jgi:GNAT superfamily N-acetyltransferase